MLKFLHKRFAKFSIKDINQNLIHSKYAVRGLLPQMAA